MIYIILILLLLTISISLYFILRKKNKYNYCKNKKILTGDNPLSDIEFNEKNIKPWILSYLILTSETLQNIQCIDKDILENFLAVEYFDPFVRRDFPLININYTKAELKNLSGIDIGSIIINGTNIGDNVFKFKLNKKFYKKCSRNMLKKIINYDKVKWNIDWEDLKFGLNNNLQEELSKGYVNLKGLVNDTSPGNKSTVNLLSNLIDYSNQNSSFSSIYSVLLDSFNTIEFIMTYDGNDYNSKNVDIIYNIANIPITVKLDSIIRPFIRNFILDLYNSTKNKPIERSDLSLDKKLSIISAYTFIFSEIDDGDDTKIEDIQQVVKTTGDDILYIIICLRILDYSIEFDNVFFLSDLLNKLISKTDEIISSLTNENKLKEVCEIFYLPYTDSIKDKFNNDVFLGATNVNTNFILEQYWVSIQELPYKVIYDEGITLKNSIIIQFNNKIKGDLLDTLTKTGKAATGSVFFQLLIYPKYTGKLYVETIFNSVLKYLN